MKHKQSGEREHGSGFRNTRPDFNSRGASRRRLLTALICIACIAITLLFAAVWLAGKAATVQTELTSASQLLPKLKAEVVRDDAESAAQTVEKLKSHTAAARNATSDPLWSLAGTLPWLGDNFRAATEISTGVDDVVRLGAAPLVEVFRSLDWKKLVPSSDGADVTSLVNAKPRLVSAAHAIRASADRLNSISTDNLLPQITGPLLEARRDLSDLRVGMDAAADASTVAPEMLGLDGPRRYLLLVQNNAEVRATGGIPGALAILTVNNGKFSLDSQSSAGRLGTFSPPLRVDPDQQSIYSRRLGKFMQDVNLTPDFPTAAATAQAMWEKRTGLRTDGVVSVDPVALSYILDATGPIQLGDSKKGLSQRGLPSELSAKNVVATLLSDVYAEIDDTAQQDAYFANVAMEIFGALSSGSGDAKGLIDGVSRAASERRIQLWSADPDLQSLIHKYALSGSISGPSVSPAEFGVYFNDGTGAKMDFYVERTVRIAKECTTDGYSRVKVLVKSTNSAPADAATSLPAYVTGAGVFGVPEGTVQTNIVAYGPVQSNVETAVIDGRKVSFASQRHAGRPVGSVTVRLAPGQSKTVELTFGKIVQHTEPQLSVTPTVQSIKEVLLDSIPANCVPATS